MPIAFSSESSRSRRAISAPAAGGGLGAGGTAAGGARAGGGRWTEDKMGGGPGQVGAWADSGPLVPLGGEPGPPPARLEKPRLAPGSFGPLPAEDVATAVL